VGTNAETVAAQPRSFRRRWERARLDTEWLSVSSDVAPSAIAGVITTLVTWGIVGGRIEDLAIPLAAGLIAATLFLLLKNSIEFVWNFAVAGYKNEVDDLRVELARPKGATPSVGAASRLLLGELQVIADQVLVVWQTRPHPHYSENFHLSTARWDAHEPTIASDPNLHTQVAQAYVAIQSFNNRFAMRMARKSADTKLLAVISDDHLEEVERTVTQAILALRATPGGC
jgi:hypothetical protein